MLLGGFLCPPAIPVFIIIYFSLGRQRTVETPLCESHRNYWGWRGFWIFFPLVLLVIFVLVQGMLAISGQIDEDFFWPIISGSLIVFVFWAAYATLVNIAMVRATEITEFTITLQRVHFHFAEAVRSDRGEAEIRPQSELAWDHYEPYPRPTSR
jgi:hypothetical protein